MEPRARRAAPGCRCRTTLSSPPDPDASAPRIGADPSARGRRRGRVTAASGAGWTTTEGSPSRPPAGARDHRPRRGRRRGRRSWPASGRRRRRPPPVGGRVRRPTRGRRPTGSPCWELSSHQGAGCPPCPRSQGSRPLRRCQCSCGRARPRKPAPDPPVPLTAVTPHVDPSCRTPKTGHEPSPDPVPPGTDAHQGRGFDLAEPVDPDPSGKPPTRRALTLREALYALVTACIPM